MAKKGIIVVTNHYKNVKSGVGTVANALINELKDDFNVLVICPEREVKEEPGVELKTVRLSKFDPSNYSWISFARESSKVIRSLDQRNYSLVIYLDAREGLFCNRTETPSLGIIHDFMSARFGRLSKQLIEMYPDWPKRYVYYKVIKKLEEKAYRRLTHLVTVCDYTRKQLVENYSINKSIDVIWNGIELSRLKQPIGKKEKNTITFICGNPYLKGLPNLLKAVELVSESVPDIKCYVIGKKEHMGKLPEHSPHAQFIGPQDYEVTMSYLDRSEVYCMPSLFESFSMAYLEAIFYNTQVIASKNTGAPEIVKFFDSLKIVDPLDVNQIAETIKSSLGKKTKVSAKSLEIISAERMGEDYKKLIKGIVNGR